MSMEQERGVILYADDDPDYRLLAQYAWQESRLDLDLKFAEDGQELMDYLWEKGKFRWTLCPRPTVIFLDLSISKKDGREILATIREDASLRAIPVVVLTTSEVQEEIHRGSDLPADLFARKPLTAEGLRATLHSLTAGARGDRQ
jgi:two-component system, response regulator